MDWNIPNPHQFIAYSGAVVNIGVFHVTFDGANRYGTWTMNDHNLVSRHFYNLEDDSEWKKVEMYKQ